MLDNQNIQGMTEGQQLVEGTPVYDANGGKLGTVSEHNVQGRYLVMHKGLLFPRDIYVPLSAIAGTSQDGIQLNVTKDELHNQQWDQPPTNSNTTTGGAVANDAAMNDASRVDTRRTSGHATPTRDGDMAIPVREEELVAGTRQNEAGRVRLHKDVVEEQQSINVPVTHEEVTVERFPVQGNAAAADLGQDAFQERDIEVPVMGEEIITEKRGRVTEEVHLHKQAVTEQQQVTDTVRKERMNVSSEGDVETQGLGNQGLRNRDQFEEEQQPLS